MDNIKYYVGHIFFLIVRGMQYFQTAAVDPSTSILGVCLSLLGRLPGGGAGPAQGQATSCSHTFFTFVYCSDNLLFPMKTACSESLPQTILSTSRSRPHPLCGVHGNLIIFGLLILANKKIVPSTQRYCDISDSFAGLRLVLVCICISRRSSFPRMSSITSTTK